MVADMVATAVGALVANVPILMQFDGTHWRIVGSASGSAAITDLTYWRAQQRDHKEDARMVPNDRRTGNHVCHTRHCLAPLCSCVDFQEAK